MEQGFLVGSPEHVKVTGCDGAAKVESYSGVARNKDLQNTKLEVRAYLMDRSTKDIKTKESPVLPTARNLRILVRMVRLKSIQA